MMFLQFLTQFIPVHAELFRIDENREIRIVGLHIRLNDVQTKTFDPFQFNAEQEIQNGAYQGWCFGPALMDGQGHAATNFNTTVKKANPRSVIGYYEPGHYCLVAVDGRSNKSKGMTIVQLAALMESLGCTQAYNLDGGQSSIMAAGTTVINKPIDGGRKSSDFIMVVDEPTR